MEYLKKWFDNLLSKPSITLRHHVSAKGECRVHTGPSIWYAAVEIAISPADGFEVEDGLKSEVSAIVNDRGWFDQIIFGVLDVMLTHATAPVRNFRMTILSVDFNEIESNAMAFRLAARNAAEKLFDLSLVP
jgi:hypothetical protein